MSEEWAGSDGRSAPRHPIGVVAQRTGLSPDVLRVWERRYEAVAPERTPGGQRLYTDADVERLQLLRKGTELGRSIGQLVQLSAAELAALVQEDEAAVRPRDLLVGSGVPEDAAAWLELGLERVERMDAVGLDALLRRLAALWGMTAFLEGLAAPLFRRIGEAWHEGRLKPAQEHLATAVMAGVLIALRSELAPAATGPALLVGTPATERHEIGALLVAAAAAAAGWRVTYLGPDLPASEIVGAAAATSARAVALSVVFPLDEEAVAAELLSLRAQLPDRVELLVGGRGAAQLGPELERAGVQLLGGLAGFREWLRRSP